MLFTVLFIFLFAVVYRFATYLQVLLYKIVVYKNFIIVSGQVIRQLLIFL